MGLVCFWSKWKEKQNELKSLFIIHIKDYYNWEYIFARRKLNIQEKFVLITLVSRKVDLKRSGVDQIQNCNILCSASILKWFWGAFCLTVGNNPLRLPVVGCCLKALSALQGFGWRTDETSRWVPQLGWDNTRGALRNLAVCVFPVRFAYVVLNV